MHHLFRFLLPCSFLSLFLTSPAWSWGGRGHYAICESAIFLVKNPELKKFLRSRPQMLGHLCNIPDTGWKSLPVEQTQLGNSAHFLDIEYLKDVPDDQKTNFIELEQRLTGTKPLENRPVIKSLHQEMGSLWWRANQFLTLASNLKSNFASAKPPSNRQEEMSNEFPFNKAVFQFVTNIGLLGHFVADGSQPLHNTVDYDGYDAGHGGLHAYYEDEIVAEFDANLSALIVVQAEVIRKTKPSFLVGEDPVKQMKDLSELSFADLPAVYAADHVIKKSEVKEDKGMKIRTPAQRNDASLEFPLFKNLILNQMARSAVLLAYFWDKAYENAGAPPLTKYKAFAYPFTPEFIPPDYLGATKERR